MTTPVDHLRQYVDFTLPRFPQRNPLPDVHGWSRVFASRFWDVVEDVLPLPLDELLRDELRGSLWSAPLFQHNWFPVSRSLRVDVPEDVVAEIRRLEWESPPTRLEQELVHQARRSLHTYGLFVPPAILGVLDDFASLSLIGCSPLGSYWTHREDVGRDVKSMVAFDAPDTTLSGRCVRLRVKPLHIHSTINTKTVCYYSTIDDDQPPSGP